MFKIDKVGFYKNRRGKKVEIVQELPFAWLDANDNHYYEDGKLKRLPFPNELDIIAHWEEPKVDTIPKEYKFENLELEEFAHETDCESKSPKIWAVADNQGEWLEVTSRKEAGEIAHKWLKETPTTTIDIWEKISCYTAEVEIKEIKI